MQRTQGESYEKRYLKVIYWSLDGVPKEMLPPIPSWSLVQRTQKEMQGERRQYVCWSLEQRTQRNIAHLLLSGAWSSIPRE